MARKIADVAIRADFRPDTDGVRLAFGALHLAIDFPLAAAAETHLATEHLLDQVQAHAALKNGLGHKVANRLRVQEKIGGTHQTSKFCKFLTRYNGAGVLKLPARLCPFQIVACKAAWACWSAW